MHREINRMQCYDSATAEETVVVWNCKLADSIGQLLDAMESFTKRNPAFCFNFA